MEPDERCVHAVDGPDWAGLRELYPAEVDYKALIRELNYGGHLWSGKPSTLFFKAADAVESWLAIEQRLTDHIVQLAAERDALAERATALGRALVQEAETTQAALDERNALQARLDAMTVEWGTAAVAGDDRTIHRDTFRSEDAARNARGYGESIVTRLVGPWTVVPEGER
jgi:hypothetical protein